MQKEDRIEEILPAIVFLTFPWIVMFKDGFYTEINRIRYKLTMNNF